MKSTSLKLIATVLALISVNSLVACNPNRGHQANTQANADRPSGPHDGGGGTGFDGRVFASYAVNPIDLPAYKQILRPLLANIKRETPEPGYDQEPFIASYFRFKVWYIAPIDLQDVGKDTLGISFIKTKTQQIARQTKDAVWIDKRIFDKMTIQEQSDLLTHELVMTLYFLKFLSITDLCKISASLAKPEKNDLCAESNPTTMADYNVVLPQEPLRPLDETDNQHILFVENWLLQNAKQPVKEEDFVRVLQSQDFDKRFFDTSNYSEQNKIPDLKMSRKELLDAIHAADLTGNKLDTCEAYELGQSKPCTNEISETDISYSYVPPEGGASSTIPIKALHFKLTLPGEGSVEFSSPPGDDDLSLFPYTDGEGTSLYGYGIADWSSSVKKGDRLHTGFIFFRQKTSSASDGLQLESIVLVPGVVVSIDKTRDPICNAEKPKAVGFLDDVLFVHRKDYQVPARLKAFAMIQPIASCTVANVAE